MALVPDPVALLCELADTCTEIFAAEALRRRHGDAAEQLVRIGALVPGAPSPVVTCGACDEDHPATVEFDAGRGRSHHFCPEAGRVALDDADLATLCFYPEWLLDWLEKALPVVPPARRRVLVPDRAWHLGEAVIGATSVMTVFVRGISSVTDLDRFAAVLDPIAPADLGLVVTTTTDRPRRTALPHDHVFLDLREIAEMGEEGFVLDRSRLGACIKGLLRKSNRPVRDRRGRPSEKALVRRIHRERRERHLPVISRLAEAKEIRQEIASRYPDRELPAVKTISGHLRQLDH
jgi:hypothetical protein